MWKFPPTASAPPDHRHIQGRQFSNEEWESINRSLDRPLGTLNCQHFATPIVLGVSKPVYSRKELTDINRRSSERIEYKGQKMSRYEASQRQRQMETAIAMQSRKGRHDSRRGQAGGYTGPKEISGIERRVQAFLRTGGAYAKTGKDKVHDGTQRCREFDG